MADHAPESGLLSDLVVLECADTPGAAFAGVLAADFGATVIMCEPAGGTPLRRLGSPAAAEAWWATLGRNKLSLTLDLDHAEAAALVERLAARADMIVRDDCARGAALAAAARDAADVRLYPTGSDRPDLWPWSTRPEFAAAASGMMALTGEQDGGAVQPEMPLADSCAGMMGMMLGLGELRAARLAGRAPTPVEMALHEALHRMNEWHIIIAAAFGRPERRNGNRFPMNANIGNIFLTRDGKMLTVSAATPSVADRLLTMIGGPELQSDPRFSTPAARAQNMDTLDAVIAAWFARHDGEEALRLVAQNDVVVGPIYDAAELSADPHIAERGDIVHAPAANGGAPAPMPAALPFVRPGAGAVRRAGPAPGEDSARVLAMLGLDAIEVARMTASGPTASDADPRQQGGPR